MGWSEEGLREPQEVCQPSDGEGEAPKELARRVRSWGRQGGLRGGWGLVEIRERNCGGFIKAGVRELGGWEGARWG